MRNERLTVEKAEFWINNGVHILWIKEGKKWNVTLYKNLSNALTIIDINKRPSLYNSCYLASTKMKDNSSK